MKRLLLFFMMFLLLPGIVRPVTAAADDKVYQIDKADFNVILQPDGSAEITETWTLTYKSGEFHRFYKEIYESLYKTCEIRRISQVL